MKSKSGLQAIQKIKKEYLMKTAIVTDSNCAISQEKAKKYGVYVLPMPFYVDDELYFEDRTMTHDEFYLRQQAGSKIYSNLRVLQKKMVRKQYSYLKTSILKMCSYIETIAISPYTEVLFHVRVKALKWRNFL